MDRAENNWCGENYLNLAFDLSKVFFSPAANSLDTVPRPLLDRLEVLGLTGYSEEEKLEIAKRYLIPRQRTQSGLKPEQLTIPDDTVKKVISRYTREAGVRRLEQMLGRLTRKIAA